MSIIETEKRGNVAVVTLNDPSEKVNKLNEELIDQFLAFLDDLKKDNSLRGAIIVSGKEDNFIAGADIKMFTQERTPEEFSELSRKGQHVLSRVENFPKPIVACIHGSCMGGGTELALACHYRILSDHRNTRIALPEVQLGLIPGMGGTQRLPRLIGIQKSLSYMLTGKNMYSRPALDSGFADEIVNRYKMKQAGIAAVRRYANRAVERKDKRRIFEKLLEKNAAGRLIIFSQAHKRTAQQTRGNYPAPPQIIESVRHGFREGFEAGLKNESEIFGRLAASPESQALVQLFFAMTEAKKNPGGDQAEDIQQIGVVGAGLMGTGITEVSIDNGLHVWLKDRQLEQAVSGKKKIYSRLQKEVGKNILSEFERDTLLSRVHPSDTYDVFKKSELVIEAVFEDLDLKRGIIKELEKITGGNCIIASNTSSLPITDIAAGSKYPENIVGMHYFSPVQKMPLLEIVKTAATSDRAIAAARKTGLKQGKAIIVVNDGPGFYTTRILSPLMNEALLLLGEGAAIDQIDSAMKDFGFPVGPLTLFDEVGIDVGAHISGILRDVFEKRGIKTANKAAELVDAGYRGRKSGAGFYLYGENRGEKKINSEIYRFFGDRNHRKHSDADIQFRLAMQMVNEAVFCLQEDILTNPRDGDLGAAFGLGFPPYLGGPFRYIDREGAEEVADFLKELERTHGIRFRPAELLLEKAGMKQRFHS
ncbi:MAG: 3-hydroxyacyl-CoA dehydrogenase NAD-binding domain-containing protein [Balneolaceae bacterium]